MFRVAVFIDGGYLDGIQRYELNNRKVDLAALSSLIARTIHREADILRSYYYHCPPYKGDPPTPEESYRFANMESFLSTVDQLPRFVVQRGRLARRGPNQAGQFSFEQKMVDTLLSIDLVQLSAKGQITHAAILAGDSDFVPALTVAKNEGISTWLFHGDRPHRDLWAIADERRQLTLDFLQEVLRTS